jgi:hypothetical protein
VTDDDVAMVEYHIDASCCASLFEEKPCQLPFGDNLSVRKPILTNTVMFTGQAVDFVFLFNHSSGHSEQRPDSLNRNIMNRLFRGKNTAARQSTIIEQEKGYLGAFPRILEPGATQSLVFSQFDSGPFWMLAVKKEDTRHDK